MTSRKAGEAGVPSPLQPQGQKSPNNRNAVGVQSPGLRRPALPWEPRPPQRNPEGVAPSWAAFYSLASQKENGENAMRRMPTPTRQAASTRRRTGLCAKWHFHSSGGAAPFEENGRTRPVPTTTPAIINPRPAEATARGPKNPGLPTKRRPTIGTARNTKNKAVSTAHPGANSYV